MVDEDPWESAADGVRVDNEQPGWVSVAAVAWVLDRAPCPAPLVSTLIAFARHADQTGRNSRPAIASIVRMTGKHRRQVIRDIAALVKLDLLRYGDQGAVEHLPEGQRPVVYDLPLSVSGEKPVSVGRGGKGTSDVGVTGRGDVGVTGTSDADVRGTGDVGVTQKNPVNNPLKKPVEEPPSLRSRASLARGHASENATTIDQQGRRSASVNPGSIPKPRRITTERSCGYPGCTAGAILVPESVDPLGMIRCPGCWVTDDKVDHA